MTEVTASSLYPLVYKFLLGLNLKNTATALKQEANLTKLTLKATTNENLLDIYRAFLKAKPTEKINGTIISPSNTSNTSNSKKRVRDEPDKVSNSSDIDKQVKKQRKQTLPETIIPTKPVSPVKKENDESDDEDDDDDESDEENNKNEDHKLETKVLPKTKKIADPKDSDNESDSDSDSDSDDEDKKQPVIIKVIAQEKIKKGENNNKEDEKKKPIINQTKPTIKATEVTKPVPKTITKPTPMKDEDDDESDDESEDDDDDSDNENDKKENKKLETKVIPKTINKPAQKMNGKDEKETNGDTYTKTTPSYGKKKGNRSFQRVNVNILDGVKPELQDNSFYAKNEQYGAKANRDFSTVKGKGFRHEKTKKKRGTYKPDGGRIDSGRVNSVKFD